VAIFVFTLKFSSNLTFFLPALYLLLLVSLN
jgi:hypothetical protein